MSLLFVRANGVRCECACVLFGGGFTQATDHGKLKIEHANATLDTFSLLAEEVAVTKVRHGSPTSMLCSMGRSAVLVLLQRQPS